MTPESIDFRLNRAPFFASAVGLQGKTWMSRIALEEGCVVALDLTEVKLVDRDAVTLLARTEGNGIELRNCPAYIRGWVTRERGSS